METLQRLKLLAIQCATTSGHSPTRSPSASVSPAKSPYFFHLRRRRSRRGILRRLLSRRKDESDNKTQMPNGEGDGRRLLKHTSLKDLLVSSSSSSSPSRSPSSPAAEEGEENNGSGGGRGSGWRRGLEGLVRRGGGIGRMRSAVAGGGAFRYRLLRRPWRPVLVTIPE